MLRHPLTIFIAISLVCLSFNQLSHLMTPSNLSQTYPTACTPDQIQNVHEVIDFCQDKYDDVTDVASCFLAIMQKGFNQYWNMYTFIEPQANGLSYWHMEMCRVILKDYGQYQFSYIAWPVQPIKDTLSQGGNRLTEQEMKQLFNQLNFQKSNKIIKVQPMPQQNAITTPNGECLPWRYPVVQMAIQSCDLKNNKDAAECIEKIIFKTINEEWGVFVLSDEDSSALRIWNFDYCSLDVDPFGKYNREVFTWKAWPNLGG